MGVTSTFLPGAGWLKGDRVAYAFGYNGHGVAITCLLGMSVRDLMLERDSEFANLALVGRLPLSLGPRLIRDPIVRAQSSFLQRQDDAGRELRPSWLVRLSQRVFGP